MSDKHNLNENTKNSLENVAGKQSGLRSRFTHESDQPKQAKQDKARSFEKSSSILHDQSNKDAIRRLLAAGYPIASGVIEGACKHLIGDRMYRTGMRWEFEGAQPMLDLRVTKLNQ